MLRDKKYKWYLLFIIIVSAIVIIGLLKQKAGMHVDEYYSYGLANHEDNGDIYIAPPNGEKLDAREVFDDYFYADDFSIHNVWANQTYDVHPPFYYLLFHIWGLITHNFLGLKTGVLFNLIFHIINIGLVYIIIDELLKEKERYALIGAFLYAFSPVVLGNVLFIRMYVMVQTFILLLILCTIKRKTQKQYMVCLYLISVAGALTHYYFLVFLFYYAIVYLLKMCITKKWKEFWKFIGVMVGAGGTCIIVFPAMLKHIFRGYVGTETFDNLKGASLHEFTVRFRAFYDSLDSISGNLFMPIVLVSLVIIVCARIEKKNFILSNWSIIIFPNIMYILTISQIGIGGFTRYISPIYGVWIVMIIGMIALIAEQISTYHWRSLAAFAIVCIMINTGWHTYEWPELHLDAKEGYKIAKEYGVNNECIFVFNRIWRGMPSYQDFIQYQKISFIPDDNLLLLDKENYCNYDHVVVYFDKKIGEENIEKILNKIVENNKDIHGYTLLYEYSYNQTYYLE